MGDGNGAALTRAMETVRAIFAAGGTDAGLLRDVNEDRFHVDASRGLFIVIDGVGGQAAGGKAADIALSMLRERLERETGPVADRVREAITIANNEIYRLASTRPAWNGMACVLTVAVVTDGRATIGHVGDTRLYKLRDGAMEKITRDHSPVGEREDAHALSEREAMRHPRRHEVYRDVGSDSHAPADPDFIDVLEIPFEPDAALLLCSDGLTDLVDSASIGRTVGELAGDPPAIVNALLEAANGAGGRDNVTVVYVEGERFAMSQWRQANRRQITGRRTGEAPRAIVSAGSVPAETGRGRRVVVRGVIVVLLLALAGLGAARGGARWPWPVPDVRSLFGSAPASRVLVVRPTESIAAALAQAEPGSEIVVEPGEYRERIVLKDGIRLVSRLPRAAIIRLPATAPNARPEPAVIAIDVPRTEFAGFAIVGDARTPLGVGIHVAGSGVSLIDLEVTGATESAIVFAGGSAAMLVGSEIHDNPGAALTILAGAGPRLTQNVFRRNGLSAQAAGTFGIERGAAPRFQRNVFLDIRPDIFPFDEQGRAALEAENWFVSSEHSAPARATSTRLARQP